MYYSNNKLISPTTFNELHDCIRRKKDSIIYAGGTYLMNQSETINHRHLTILDISHIKELEEITRNIRYVDVGCMVTANKLLEIGHLAFNDLLLDTLYNTATHIVRNQITVGGAICTPDIRYSLPGTLAIMDTSVELLDLTQGKISTKLVPINKLYNQNGELQLEKGILIKKIRISLENYDFEKFFCVGDPIRNPGATVILSFRANIEQTMLSKVNMCITFPTSGMFFAEKVAMELDGAQLPLTPSRAITISEKLITDMKKNFTGVSDIQFERSKRMLQSILFELSPKQESVEKTD